MNSEEDNFGLPGFEFQRTYFFFKSGRKRTLDEGGLSPSPEPVSSYIIAHIGYLYVSYNMTLEKSHPLAVLGEGQLTEQRC